MSFLTGCFTTEIFSVHFVSILLIIKGTETIGLLCESKGPGAVKL